MTGVIGIYRVDGLNLKASAGAMAAILPGFNTALAIFNRFLPQKAYVHLRALGGTFTTAPVLRIGTNGTHDNVCPAFTVLTSTIAGQIWEMPLASPLIAPNIGTDILLELQTSAAGSGPISCDIILTGLLLG